MQTVKFWHWHTGAIRRVRCSSSTFKGYGQQRGRRPSVAEAEDAMMAQGYYRRPPKRSNAPALPAHGHA